MATATVVSDNIGEGAKCPDDRTIVDETTFNQLGKTRQREWNGIGGLSPAQRKFVFIRAPHTEAEEALIEFLRLLLKEFPDLKPLFPKEQAKNNRKRMRVLISTVIRMRNKARQKQDQERAKLERKRAPRACKFPPGTALYRIFSREL